MTATSGGPLAPPIPAGTFGPWARAVSLVGAASAESRLGLIPPIALAGSVGLLLVALSDSLSRLRVPHAPLLFWAGLLVLVLPAAGRLLGTRASRNERLWLVVLLGLGLYTVKVLHSPAGFTLFDEFHHWVTLQDIVSSERLFAHNNVLPASPYYPGLEIVASVLVKAGLPVWESGVLVVAACRVLLMLSLFLFVERASGSTRLAGAATLIYAANPSFLFFDSQFGYESLGLPLAVFVIYCVARRERGPGTGAFPLTVAILLGICGVIVTHHVSSIALAIFLIGWAIVTAIVHRLASRDLAHPGWDPPGLLGPALVAVIGTIAWMLYIASVTVGYLAPAFGGALNQVIDLVAGEETGRELFNSSSGLAAPVWEQLAGYASVLVLLVALPIGALVLWRSGRRNPAIVAIGFASLAYPASLIARLTVRGAELAARSAEFVFVALGVVVAVAALTVIADSRLRGHGRALVLAGVGTLFVGGAILGLPNWARFPGPYLVSADTRSVEPIGISAAVWMRDHLGINNRLITDRTNRTLTATYGRQHPITAVGDRVDIKRIYFTTALDVDDLKVLRDVNAHYVQADDRLSTSVPYVGVYVERGEMFSLGPWRAPMPAAALAKWDVTEGVDRIYDNGPIQIYDVSPLVLGRLP